MRLQSKVERTSTIPHEMEAQCQKMWYICSQCGKKYMNLKFFNNHQKNACELYFECNHCSCSTNFKPYTWEGIQRVNIQKCYYLEIHCQFILRYLGWPKMESRWCAPWFFATRCQNPFNAWSRCSGQPMTESRRCAQQVCGSQY